MISQMMVFTIAGEELRQLRGFIRDHRGCSDSPEDQFNYLFFPTPGGMIKTVFCSCGQCIDLEADDAG